MNDVEDYQPFTVHGTYTDLILRRDCLHYTEWGFIAVILWTYACMFKYTSLFTVLMVGEL